MTNHPSAPIPMAPEPGQARSIPFDVTPEAPDSGENRSPASFVDIARSLLFYSVFYSVSLIWLAGAFPVVRLWPKLLIGLVHGWSQFHRWCVVHLLGIDIVIEGEVPKAPALVALRHESFFEAIDLPTMLDMPAVFAKAELMRIPVWGSYGHRYGLVAVEREQGAKALRAMVSSARRLAAEGRVLAIFPEGTRIPHGTQAPLQAGFAGLYKLLGLPVVPVAVASGDCYHRLWKRAGSIKISFGQMIPAGLARADIEARVLAAINKLNV